MCVTFNWLIELKEDLKIASEEYVHPLVTVLLSVKGAKNNCHWTCGVFWEVLLRAVLLVIFEISYLCCNMAGGGGWSFQFIAKMNIDFNVVFINKSLSTLPMIVPICSFNWLWLQKILRDLVKFYRTQYLNSNQSSV